MLRSEVSRLVFLGKVELGVKKLGHRCAFMGPASTMSFQIVLDPLGKVLGLKSLAQLAPKRLGLLGTLFDFPESSASLKIITLPPCIPIADRFFYMSLISAICMVLSRIVQINMK